MGGRPLHSALTFVPITFEIGVLCAGLATFVAWAAYCGLPQPWHPVFDVPGFERASDDRFFVTVEGSDPRFQLAEIAELLRRNGALAVRPIDLRGG